MNVVHKGSSFECLEDARSWKTEWFPALRAVRIRDREPPSLLPQIETLSTEIEAFEVVSDDETWGRLLPPQS